MARARGRPPAPRGPGRPGAALGYHKLVLSAFPFNQAGIRAYRRAGFRDVGIYREQGLLDGRWVDTIVMENILEGPHAH